MSLSTPRYSPGNMAQIAQARLVHLSVSGQAGVIAGSHTFRHPTVPGLVPDSQGCDLYIYSKACSTNPSVLRFKKKAKVHASLVDPLWSE